MGQVSLLSIRCLLHMLSPLIQDVAAHLYPMIDAARCHKVRAEEGRYYRISKDAISMIPAQPQAAILHTYNLKHLSRFSLKLPEAILQAHSLLQKIRVYI